MFSSCNVARLRTISRTKTTRITTIVRMLRTVAGSGLKCQDSCGRRGFEERQPYSPDMNPIEMAFAKLKAVLRQDPARTIEGPVAVKRVPPRGLHPKAMRQLLQSRRLSILNVKML